MAELGPLIPDESPRASRYLRRVRGVGLTVLALVLVTLLLPLLVLCAVVLDAALWLRRRKPWIAVRLVALLWWFLVGELYGLLGLLWIGVTSPGGDSAKRRERVFALKRRWLSSHIAGVRGLFAMRFETEGLELAGPGPAIIMIRHASIIDNALSDVIVGRAHNLGLRFILKRELQMLPTIDIGGRWVPTLFVRRASGDIDRELDLMRQLTVNLGERDAVLIYPEGTRATPEKIARAKAVIEERQPQIAPLADRLQNLLPPRLGGPLVLLEAARGADIVLFGHVGLDGFQYISDIWAGGLIGTTVKMKFWRFPASDVPAGREEKIAWLYDRWQELDDWVGTMIAPAAPTPAG
jgi:1-acyl-sn-glycerol-3-phosphate acyltransferase